VLFTFLQYAFTLTVLSLPALAAGGSRAAPTAIELAWWSIALLLVSPNTASYTFVLLVLPVTLLLDAISPAAWPYLLLPYFLLTLPMPPSVSILYPRAWLLLFLFIGVGWRQRTLINHRAARITAGGIVVAGCAAAGFVTAYPERPSPNAQPIVIQPNAIYSSSPVINRAGIFYESIQGERYVIEHWQGGQFDAYNANGHTFHPSLPDSGAKIYFELIAAGKSSIGFFDVSDHRSGVIEVTPSEPHDPAISHDGQTLAFVSDGHLYLFDGRASRRLETTASPRDPSFVPGDRNIVYAAGEPHRSRVVSIDLATQRNTVLVDGQSATARPSISPDGATLLYASRQNGSWQIWATDLAQNREVQLTAGRCNSFAPAWMPDSREIVFASDCGRGLNLPSLWHRLF
jgi:hypothetical protein